MRELVINPAQITACAKLLLEHNPQVWIMGYELQGLDSGEPPDTSLTMLQKIETAILWDLQNWAKEEYLSPISTGGIVAVYHKDYENNSFLAVDVYIDARIMTFSIQEKGAVTRDVIKY